ncbi:MAG: SDR family oxidoreductase [Nocardioides sp.]|nr:SDR family oxidoreductase [Nocardioides sp.]
MRDGQQPVAIVTGAGRGIGRAITLRLAREGYVVEASDRTGSMAEDTEREASSGAVTARGLDVTDREATHEAVGEVFEHHGRLDLVVNNAMWMRYGPLPDVTHKELDRMFDVGVKGPLWLSQAAAGPMADSGGGAIVNIASVAALLGTPASAGYAAVKGAVVSMTRQLAVDLGPRRIRVNAVAPGVIQTEGQSAAMSAESVAYRKQRAPLGRLGVPEDVADAVTFLAGPEAAFITGQVLIVDGGITAAM